MTTMTAPPAQVSDPPLKRVILSSKGVDVRKDNAEGSRWYQDPETDRLLTSVTTVISNTTSKPWLAKWQAKLAAECAVDQRAAWLGLIDASPTGRDAAVDYIKGEAGRRRDQASELGTLVHDIVECFALDTSLPEMGDDVVPFADAFFDWLVEWNPTILGSECAIANQDYGYAGTLDLIVCFPHLGGPLFRNADGSPVVYIVDVKSGANLDAYMPVQLVAYRRAKEVWLRGGVKVAMPHSDRTAVLHVRPGGCKFIDVTAQANDSAFHTFLRMVEVLDWKDEQKGRMGTVVYLPDEHGQQPPPLLEDLDGTPPIAPLHAAKVYRLDHLADADPAALLELSGFGPGALKKAAVLLDKHGMLTPEFTAAIDALEEKEAAAAERRALKHARSHDYLAPLPGVLDRCVAPGIKGEGVCGRTFDDHQPPPRKPRAKKAAPAAKEA